jgi:hypothetical protein
MCAIKIFLIVTITLIAFLTPTFLIQSVKADNGTAKVYILMLPTIGGSWVDSCEQVKEGAIEASMLTGNYCDGNVPRAHPKQEDANYPPYYSAMPTVVTSWVTYKNIIILNYPGVIIVNTHGQILPVPNGYTKEEWVNKISEAMLTRRISWVHVAGYPFFYIKYENGTSETWGENGFKHFMSNINKGYVNCWTSQSNTTLIEHSETFGQDFSIGNWRSATDPELTLWSMWYAELGRPLKWSDFKDYLIMPLYEYNDTTTFDVYMTGAVIAYVKAGQRYLTDYGSGVYVHLGTYHICGGNGDPLNNYDFCKGFIGTAAALWVEANRFKPSAASWSKSAGGRDWNTTVFVHPTTIGFSKDSSYIYSRLGFAVHGIYKFPQEREGMGARFKEAEFSAWTDSSDWSDMRMKVGINSPALSKQAIGFGTELLELNTEREEEFRGLATSTIIDIGSKIPMVGDFFSVIGGLRLAGQWGGFFGLWGSGIDEYVETVDMGYYTSSLNSDPIDTYVYAETSSIVIADVRIPTSTRTGWLILPLTYCIYVAVETGILGDPWYWIGPIQKTIEIAVYFDRGAGQEDAGILGDAGNNLANARGISFPGSYHGYLDGTSDSEDWYAFTMPSAKPISIHMTPPPFVNFDLELRRPDGSLKAWSNQSAGITDTIQCITDIAGTWKIRIYKVQGSGVYSFSLEWGQCLTIDTKISSTGARLYNVKVWINSVLYYSPVTISASAGTTYNVLVETVVTRSWATYVFYHWNDGSTANPRTVHFPDTGNVTLTAYYLTACPTLFVWNGSEYMYETVLDIHAESDITVQHKIQQKLALDGMLYKLELRELDNFTSHIDQVKLYAVDSTGEWHLCPLKYANYDDIVVTKTLLLDDDKRIDLAPSETIGLRFQRPIPYSETTYFIFEINGYNKKVP